MAGVIAIAIAALALAVAAWSLAVMMRQLSVARSSSGGRALMFLAGRTGNVEHPARFIGPGQLAEVRGTWSKLCLGGGTAI